MKTITVVLLGDIAAGKGTQARLLAKRFGLKVIDVGVYSRKMAERDKRFERVKRGILSPSDAIQKFLKSQISNLKLDEGVIIDGGKMPGEAKLIDANFRKQGRKILVVYLKISKNEIIKRLRIRLQTEKRADDAPKSLKNRIDYYQKIYSKTVKFWKSRKVFKYIDGQEPVKKVNKSLEKLVIRYFNGAD